MEGGGRGVSNREGYHIMYVALSIQVNCIGFHQFSQIQSFDIFETLDETEPF